MDGQCRGAPPGPIVGTSGGGSHQSIILTQAEFDQLKRSVQLLRISQLRHIVKKFEIPVSGNKTKLMYLVLSVFQCLRNDSILVDVLREVTGMLEQPDDGIGERERTIGAIELVDHDPRFMAPTNRLLVQSETESVFGPVLAPAGLSRGTFQFRFGGSTTRIAITFLFQEGNFEGFSFAGELNGAYLEVSADDPFPRILDVTHVLNVGNIHNIFDIRMVVCDRPIMICIREYQMFSISDIARQICGKMPADIDSVRVISTACEHSDSFLLVPFLSRAIGTDIWDCPICGRLVDMMDLVVDRAGGASQDPFTVTFGLDWDLSE